MDKNIDKLNILLDNMKKYDIAEPEKCFESAEEALKISKEINNKQYMLECLLYMGKSKRILDEFQIAHNYLLESLRLFEYIDNLTLKAEVNNELGTINFTINNYQLAYEYFYKAYELTKKIKDKKVIRKIYNSLGVIFYHVGETDTSLKYLLKSENLFENSDEEIKHSIALANIAEIYIELGQYENAEKYLEQSYDIALNHNFIIGEITYYLNKAKMCRGKTALNYANQYIEKGLEMISLIKDSNIYIDLLIEKFKILEQQNQTTKALEYIKKALKIAQNKQFYKIIHELCFLLIKVYEKTDNQSEILKYYKKCYENQKQMDRLEKKNMSLNLKIQEEKIKMQQEIAKIKEKNSKLQQANSMLGQVNESIKMLNKVCPSIMAVSNTYEILNELYNNMHKIMDLSVIGIGFYNENDKEIKYLFIEQKNKKIYSKREHEIQDNIVKKTMRNKKYCLIKNIRIKNIDIKTELYLPLITDDKVIGVFIAQSQKIDAFKDYHIDMLEILASYISIAINNAKKSDILKRKAEERKRILKQLEKANEQLTCLSQKDELSELYNKRTFNQYIKYMYQSAKQNKERISIIFIDIDNFKEYNDNYGHIKGDECLKKVATAIKKVIKSEDDFLARYGGDEFIAVLKNKKIQESIEMGQVIKEEVEKLNIKHEYSPVNKHVTVSVGVVSVVVNNKYKIDEILALADHALYQAKNNGRNQVSYIIKEA